MSGKVERKRYIIFYRNYKYEGIIVSETDTHFIIDDIKEGRVHLPKHNCVLKELDDD